jgi:methyl-accepting chemotaxis protein
MKISSLRIKILLPIIILIIVGMALVSVLSSRSTSKIVHSNIMESLNTTTDGLSVQIGRWVAGLKIDLQSLSENEIFLKHLKNQDFINKFFLEGSNEALVNFIGRYTDFEGAVLFNAEGMAAAATFDGAVGKIDVKEEPWFKEAPKGGLQISAMEPSQGTGDPIFSINVPIIYNDKFYGVLGAAVSLNKFTNDMILPIKLGEEGYVYMTDAAGLMAAHKDSAKVLNMQLKDSEWGREIIASKNGTITYTDDGLEKIVVFRTEPTTGWIIASAAASNDIFGPLQALNLQAALISLIVVIILCIVINLLIKPIVNAVKNGVNFAKKIQSGDLSNRLHMTRTDEIGQLGTALDTMADSLQDRAELAGAIAAGDLTGEVKLASEQDVLGRALHSMSERLNDILGQINMAGEQIDSGSNQVSDSAQDLSQGSTQQAAAIEEIGASLNELSGRTQTNAENADSANQLSSSASSAANEGSAQMQQMVTAMAEINESGKNISKIIKTIDEIAFQTNLLALNAAVEAARAGQHGKGFAVVAEEVRNLAARSAKAAQETADLIEGSVQKGQNGTAIAERTARALEEIVTGIGKTSDLVAEIAASSKEQAEGLSQVSDGLAQVDQVVQRNTAVAEESAAAAEELSSQSSYLRQLIGQFRLKGQATTTVASAPARRTSPKPVALPSPQRAATTTTTARTSEWGQAAGKSKPVIALDDDEFGKY